MPRLLHHISVRYLSEVSGKAFRGSKDTKRGCRLSCAPVFLALRLFAAGFYAASSNCELYRSA